MSQEGSNDWWTKWIYTGGGSEDSLQRRNTEIQESGQGMQWCFYESQSSAKDEIRKEIKGQLEEFIHLHERLNAEKSWFSNSAHRNDWDYLVPTRSSGLTRLRKVSKKGGSANSGRGLSQELVRNLNQVYGTWDAFEAAETASWCHCEAAVYNLWNIVKILRLEDVTDVVPIFQKKKKKKQ